MLTLLTIFLTVSVSGALQVEKSSDVWGPLKFLVGAWEGTGKGKPGTSTVQREYLFVLGDKFLQVKDKSTYPPQKENPKGEMHEDWGLFSYDLNRNLFVLRQFHVEGFANQYRLERVGAESKVLMFITESIENIPSGWRARETYRIVNANEFTETFELAAPGKEFEVYTETHFKRKT